MVKIRIPNKMKFKKYNRRFCYNYMTIKQTPSRLTAGYLYSLRAKESGFLTINQLQTCYKTLAKAIKVKGRRKRKNNIKVFVNIDKPISAKSLGVRMGKGKGNIDHWGCAIRKGQIIFQVKKRIKEERVAEGLQQSSIRFPFATTIELFKRKYIY